MLTHSNRSVILKPGGKDIALHHEDGERSIEKGGKDEGKSG